jgi:hypothetical protein
VNEPRPKERTDGVVSRQIDDERLVHDLGSGETFCLDRTAARILSGCDGATPVSTLLRRVQDDVPGSGLTEATLWMTLEQLRQHRLLEPASLGPTRFDGMSRRAMLKRASIAAAAAPVIYLVTAQRLSAQSQGTFCGCGSGAGTSSRDPGCACASNLDCCSGICMTNADTSMTCGAPTSIPNVAAGLCCENFTCDCSSRAGVSARLAGCTCASNLDCCSGICMTNADTSMTCGPPTSIPNPSAAPCCP